MRTGRGSAIGRAVAVLGALALVAGPAGPALAAGQPSDGSGPGEHATTIATAEPAATNDRKNGISSVLRVGEGPNADLTTRAEALTNCNGCRSVALAVQVAIVGHVENQVHASNDATAINLRCMHCSSIALSYQFVVVSRDRLVLHKGSRARIELIIGEMRRIARLNYSNRRLRVQEDLLAADLARVLKRGVVRIVDHRQPSGAAPAPPTVDEHADHDGDDGSACVGGSC
jgi:hypothetical protein